MRIALTAFLLLSIVPQTVSAAPSFRTRSTEVKGLTCNIKTVGYRFVGKAGQSFRYAGNEFTVPATGSIELVSSRKKTTYEIAGGELQLDVWPADKFGIRTIALPRSF